MAKPLPITFIYSLGGTPTVLVRSAVVRMGADGHKFTDKKALLAHFHNATYTVAPKNPNYEEIVASLDRHPAVLRMGQSPEDKAESLASFAPILDIEDTKPSKEETGGAIPGFAAKGPPRLVAKTAKGKVLHRTNSEKLKTEGDAKE